MAWVDCDAPLSDYQAKALASVRAEIAKVRAAMTDAELAEWDAGIAECVARLQAQGWTGERPSGGIEITDAEALAMLEDDDRALGFKP